MRKKTCVTFRYLWLMDRWIKIILKPPLPPFENWTCLCRLFNFDAQIMWFCFTSLTLGCFKTQQAHKTQLKHTQCAGSKLNQLYRGLYGPHLRLQTGNRNLSVPHFHCTSGDYLTTHLITLFMHKYCISNAFLDSRKCRLLCRASVPAC